ncbi:hypothetical protein GCM10009837_07450 [Streptomyces durmitorensis]|uniref:Uncharacterized protein n=1 Tax=Streptomyces durmitorensis TaxID=319947 RepID=A0ABY4PM39_9ACTN|nr:DUF6205 family protein [Streptomyces durmitorensis]UQT54364.1 hypothetical protein M4V62_04275 [Streptomyces durmitorensis]
MGYTTHVSGEFAIEPPLAYTEFKDSKFAPDNMTSSWSPSLALRVDEQMVEKEDGVFLRRTATALVMREIDEYRERGLVDEVQSAIDSFPGHTFTGRLECEGEENADIWRVVVRDGSATRIEPRIVWPDDERE